MGQGARFLGDIARLNLQSRWKQEGFRARFSSSWIITLMISIVRAFFFNSSLTIPRTISALSELRDAQSAGGGNLGRPLLQCRSQSQGDLGFVKVYFSHSEDALFVA